MFSVSFYKLNNKLQSFAFLVRINTMMVKIRQKFSESKSTLMSQMNRSQSDRYGDNFDNDDDDDLIHNCHRNLIANNNDDEDIQQSSTLLCDTNLLPIIVHNNRNENCIKPPLNRSSEQQTADSSHRNQSFCEDNHELFVCSDINANHTTTNVTPSKPSSSFSMPISLLSFKNRPEPNHIKHNMQQATKLFQNNWLIILLLSIMMILLIGFIWLLAIIESTLSFESSTTPNKLSSHELYKNVDSSTILSFEKLSNNGSIQQMSDLNSKAFVDERMSARERIKQNHLNYIREQLIHVLLAGRTPPSPNVTASSLSADVDVYKIKQVVESGRSSDLLNHSKQSYDIDSILNLAPTSPTLSPIETSPAMLKQNIDIYAQRLQSFYPSCQNFDLFMPENFSKEKDMHLNFDLIFPRSTDARTHIDIQWAKLRLWKLNGPRCFYDDAGNNLETGESCKPIQLILSLYQIVPLSKKHLGSRLIDRRIISSSYRGYIEFNIQNVVHDWNNNQPNNGVIIVIQDRFENRLTATDIINPMNCSDPAVPIPNLAKLFGEQIFKNGTLDQSKNERQRYPTLDLMTMVLARDTNSSNNGSSGLTGKSNKITSDNFDGRRRRRSLNSTPIPSSTIPAPIF
ncbi:hypothetical protein NH340_JMT08656 [Sarcoptes scabiei]|nr:hypothetical protein NH340_JMT08656 [Sarcoptes scabiei]